MEEVLRQMLLFFGGLAIIGIFVHGMWTIRKKPKSADEQTYQPRDWHEDGEDGVEPKIIEAEFEVDENDPLLRIDEDDITDVVSGQYDELGLGEVRVVSRSESSDEKDSLDEETPVESPVLTEAAETQTAEVETAEKVTPKIYASVVTQPKPEFEAEQKQSLTSKSPSTRIDIDEIPEPPSFLLKQEQKVSTDVSDDTPTVKVADEKPKSEPTPEVTPPEKFSLAEQAKNLVKRKKTDNAPRKRKEPKVREDQMRIDFDEPEQPQDELKATQESPAEQDAPKQEVLVLNVKAAEDNPIQGAALLPMLLTLGFKFGDQDIFHRHVNSNGKGPVLFSLANMFKPGNFDIDNLENFTTQGVSLFMILPIEGDPHQVFNMMHNAARKISDEFGAQVLDSRRGALNKQNLQQYVEKIREFERMRRIAR